MGQETPWSSISPLRFLRDVANNRPDGQATLTVRQRHDVPTRLWWTLTWLDERGFSHSEAASSLDLLMRRAAQAELTLRAEWEREAGDGPTGA